MSNFDSLGFNMPDFGTPGLDMSDFDMPEFHMPNFNFDMPADGIAPVAFQWFDENPTTDFVSSATPVTTVAQVSLFQADLDMLDDPTKPSESKMWIFDVFFNDIIPYRFHDHLRLFPNIEFYSTLLYNRSDRSTIWGLVVRFHEWISNVAASSPEDADEAIEALKLRASVHDWPQKSSDDPDHSVKLASKDASIQQQLAMPPSSTPPVPDAVPNTGHSRPLSPTRHKHPLLEAELVVTPVFQYRGIIENMEHSKELDSAYERHVKRANGETPNKDASWPASSEQQRAYVKKLFESITELDDFFELRKARERLHRITNTQQEGWGPEAPENPRKRRRGGVTEDDSLNPSTRPKGMSKTDWALLNDQDWFCKYAGAPSKERGAKLSNDLLNGRRDIQNQVGRDTIREKTSMHDWTTSDDFEIRNKAGELVLKGGHLADKKRRQLAVRNKE
ncbi:uncharacterized protein N0V96_002997 [Colletotrichum fioriniae]|uniref:uncharacterized protein n=1 Tax=Colletotrichum fioriniae TaxID=710243 RepID=UPI002300A414|nr:uncharacterized protein COL516b_002835 [Colletotrichum fioriniae]KAJ0309587.1 hypothetical protein COL516b_002835 [Colletotrichum fioriniae]KAJ3946626.1 hypothetical protein N0V96_002997 [Colletotrichum fioriniae]